MAYLNPNKCDIFRLGEPFPGLAGKVSTMDCDYFRLGEPYPGLLNISLTGSNFFFRHMMM